MIPADLDKLAGAFEVAEARQGPVALLVGVMTN